MAADELSDSYVLDLLKKEAADKSLRYSALGLTAFQPQKRSSGAPKPNTRFLRNIVRDVDQHNTALLAKEAQESRERLWRLRDKSLGLDKRQDRERHGSRERQRKRVRYDEDRDNRPRRRSIERYTSKRRESEDVGGEASGRDKDVESRRGKDAYRRREKGERNTERRHRQRRSKSISSGSSRSRSRSQSRTRTRSDHRDKSVRRSRRTKRRSRSKSRTRSPSPDEASSRTHRPSGKKSSRRRSYSSDSHEEQISPGKPRHVRNSDQRADDTNNLNSQLSSALRQKRQPIKSRTKRSPSPSALSNKSESSDDIGPYLPPSTSSGSLSRSVHAVSTAPRVRGRGAINGESAMTARFNPSYDPTIDVQPEEDADDWDMALEAMRDRQRWKQQGAERLRSAGFDDTFIEAWETNTTKDESKIKWAKDSSAREWDRGKVVDDETGEINLKPAWA